MPTTCQLTGFPSQNWLDSHTQFADGRNDGFVESGSGPVSMGYWEQADQPFYYSLASAFPIADRYFCSVLGQTFPNRRYLISATSIGMVNDTQPALTDYPANGTMFDRLNSCGITGRTTTPPCPPTELYPPAYFNNPGNDRRPTSPLLRRRRGRHPAGLLHRRAELQRHVGGGPAEHRPGRAVRCAGHQRRDERAPGGADAADLELRRARRVLRPRAAAAGHRPGRRPAGRAGRGVGLQRLRAVRFPGAVRRRLARGPGRATSRIRSSTTPASARWWRRSGTCPP